MRLFLLLLVCWAASAQVRFTNRKIFVSKFAGKPLTLAQVQQTRKQIREQALANLYGLDPVVKSDLLRHADEALKVPYPVVLAQDLLDFTRTGNRQPWERKEGQHQQRLSLLVVGNLLEQEHNKSTTKYLDEIANGIWQVMEMSSWSNPAHMALQGQLGMPIPGKLSLDLSSGEMSKRISWAKLLLSDKLDHVSPVINKRIDAELSTRVLRGFLDHDFGWAGFGAQHEVNNWNIWLNGNILKTAVFTLDDITVFNQVLNKTLYSADFFLDGYGDDGGCDEGPAYWRQAGGRLVEYLESLAQLYPDGQDYFRSVQLLKRIGDYSYKMLIERDWFVNYADSIPINHHPPAIVALYGILLNDESMKEYAGSRLALINERSYWANVLGSDINEFWNYLSTYKQIHTYSKKAPIQDLVWLPDIQVVNSRSKKTATTNFFLGAKAGNNHEQHNHNDVGNFVLFQNGHPVMIDIGVGTYSAQTFNSHRYELFYMQSQYHNCPTINGVLQKDGHEFNSHNTTLKEFPNQEGILFSSDIAGAYPKDAKVKQWMRSFQFNRTSNHIQIDDQFQLEQFVAPQRLHFITVRDMKATKNEHGLLLSNANVSVQMDFDWKHFTLNTETKSFDGDHHLGEVWGESVQRITLTATDKEVNGHYTVRFTQG